MKKLTLTSLMLASLVGCTATSGPNYSVSSLTLPSHDHAYRVSCGGVFGSSKTCLKVAARICGDRQVNQLESSASYKANGGQGNPDSLMFECEETSTPAPGTPGAAAPTPASALVAAEPVPVERVNLAGDALFATGLATLTLTARAKLDALLARQDDAGFTRVSVTGYTDSVGIDASNLVLSQNRAQAVAGYLKSHGLNARTIEVTGRGRADPVASNATVEGRASNRRVEISLER